MLRRAGCRSKRHSGSPATRICGHSVAWHRMAWCAIQWRPRLGETRRTGRALVAGRFCVDPLERGDECCEYRDYHRSGEKYDGGTVATPLVTYKAASTLE
jgi:hypothetical protein